MTCAGDVSRGLMLLSALSFGAGCSTGLTGQEAERELTASIELPSEGKPLVDPETDTSVTVNSDSSSTAPVKVSSGASMNVRVPFSSSGSNVVGAGIRFGTSGPIRTIPINGASGQSSGTLSFQARLPSDICNKLAKICHDIKCYEYAVTSAGKVSRGNVTSMAVLCGDCNEPSCKGLVDASACSSPTPSTIGQTQCSDAARCPNGSTLKSCVTVSPTGATSCWYEVGGSKVTCSSCTGAGLNTCAQTAANKCSG